MNRCLPPSQARAQDGTGGVAGYNGRKFALTNGLSDADSRQCTAAWTFEEHRGTMQLSRGNRGKRSNIALVLALLKATLDQDECRMVGSCLRDN